MFISSKEINAALRTSILIFQKSITRINKLHNIKVSIGMLEINFNVHIGIFMEKTHCSIPTIQNYA